MFFSNAERDAFVHYIKYVDKKFKRPTKTVQTLDEWVDSLIWNSVVYEQYIGHNQLKSINELVNFEASILQEYFQKH